MGETPAVGVRHERPGDEAEIARVNDAAFGQPDESRLVEAVRRTGQATISLVAFDERGIIGHILFTPVRLESPGSRIAMLGLGPMAVLPGWQRQGVGSMLVEAGLRECTAAGCQAVVVVGHPDYYPRFGFRRSREFGLRCEYAVPEEVFMAIELVPGALAGRGGPVRYLPAFGGAEV